MIKRIYGVNIAVKNLDEAVARYESAIGVKAEPLREADFAFPGLIGAKLNVNGVYLTLIASKTNNTAVSSFLERKGEGVFLVSLEVDSIENDSISLKERGLVLLLDQPARGEFGAVNFVHPKSMHGVQLEIIQPNVA